MGPLTSKDSRAVRLIKRLDLFPKVQAQSRSASSQGAIATIFAALLLAVLFISEFRIYLHVEELHDIEVDLSREEYIPVVLNITFPRLACSLVAVDAADVAGNVRYDIASDIVKTRIDRNGHPIDVAVHEEVGSDADIPDELKRAWEKPQNYCGSCYVPEDAVQTIRGVPECCNTCYEVVRLHRVRGWRVEVAEQQFEQCYREREEQRVIDANEGCLLDASIKVPKVLGGILIAPGRSTREVYRFTSQMRPGFDARGITRFDTAHTIRSLSFGEPYPGMVQPLDRVRKDLREGTTAVFKYFIKVVPTIYEPLGAPHIVTNQYAVTEHYTVLDPKARMSGPGIDGSFPSITFRYSMSGLKVHVREYRHSFKHFVTHVCALVGGVFVCTGLIHHSVRSGIASVFRWKWAARAKQFVHMNGRK